MWRVVALALIAGMVVQYSGLAMQPSKFDEWVAEPKPEFTDPPEFDNSTMDVATQFLNSKF
jgi:hypothetical protein